MSRRVVVTGVGLLTAAGVGHEAVWDAMCAGRSGVREITGFDASSLRTHLAGEIDDFNARDYVPSRRMLRMMTRNDQLAIAGATLAMRDAGLDADIIDGSRVAVYTGGNKEVSRPDTVLEAALAARRPDGTVDMQRLGKEASRVYPLFYVEGLPGASLFYLSERFGLLGPNTYFPGSGDAAATAIGTGYRAVRRGDADAAVVGGFDDPVWWWPMSRLDGFGTLTRDNHLGAAAFRPYDRRRSGTVLGEGAAFVILEEADQASARGARIYAEMVGYGSGYDAHDVVAPHPHGRGLTHALHAALRQVGVAPEAVDFVATHGTATAQGDISEARALRSVFGSDGAQPLASTVKPVTGHLVGGSGALNAAVATLAVAHGRVPPTLNLEDVDPECAFNWVTGDAREADVRVALAIARGFEGHNVVLALQRY